MKEAGTALKIAPNARKVLEARYLIRNEEGKHTETPEQLFERVARCIAASDARYGATPEQVEKLADEFYGMMTSLDFLPNSPTLMNAGRPLGQLSACFVLPVEDSMESIFDAVKNAAIIHKSGGGTGFSFSRLRPSGDVVGSTKGISSGPVSFMTVFDTATEAVKQGGTRRGANMGMLRVDHPDILKFITCKDDTTKLNNFNISVAITDEFMRAVEQGGTYQLKSPRTGEQTGTLNAREVFDLVVSHAWGTGEPGIVFIDRINQGNPTPRIGAIESTNPCGEQPLLPFESCNLGSINLSRMITRDETGAPKVDYRKLGQVTRKAVRFLDNVIDANKYPLDEIARMTLANRKIGLGVMGWADMLIQLGVAYNSAEAARLGEEVMGAVQAEGWKASEELARERGAFENFAMSVFAGGPARRNATVTTIAPTGTLSIIAGCSSGIEPIFAVSYVRNVMEGTKLVEVNPLFESVAKERGFWSRDLMEKIAEAGSIQGFEEIPEDVKRVFVTSHDISPVDHVSMQAAFQRHVDNAVSKTVNFCNSATKQEVEDVYMLSYRLGCKGVTVYRDGSRDAQVLSTGKKADKTAAAPSSEAPVAPRRRPSLLVGSTRAMSTGCGKFYVTINEDEDGRIFEIFTSMGKAGGCASSQCEALGRMISVALRANISRTDIVRQLKGISCHQPSWGPGGKITSCADAVAKALEQHIKVHHEKEQKDEQAEAHGGNGKSQKAAPAGGSDGASVERAEEFLIVGACEECGGAVEHEGGCAVCHDCGHTKCG